jgi:hypothetical protein
MRQRDFVTGLVVGIVFGIALGVAEGGDVNINIAGPPVAAMVVPAPPPVIVTRPEFVLVPGTQVYSAPRVDFNVFLFGGRYWSHHNDVWYVTARPGAPWTRVAVATVPVQVRAVPVKYYKVKPRHVREVEHEGGHRGCPPGLAKQGRC